jgi:uncharacterized protein
VEATVAAVVMALGLAGTLIPGLPGLPLIWLAALGYGLAGRFGVLGLVAMTAITALLAAGVTSKYVLASSRARTSGAPKSTILAGALCGFAGFFVVPVIGFVLGAVGGVLLAELRRVGSWARAWDSTREVVVGFGLGVLLEIAAGILMIVTWAIWVLL